jgi:hypothetical protein
MKLIAKLLANRLQQIIPLIHKNQYGLSKVELPRIALPGLLSIFISATILKKK